jgi:hypothetical protein
MPNALAAFAPPARPQMKTLQNAIPQMQSCECNPEATGRRNRHVLLLSPSWSGASSCVPPDQCHPQWAWSTVVHAFRGECAIATCYIVVGEPISIANYLRRVIELMPGFLPFGPNRNSCAMQPKQEISSHGIPRVCRGLTSTDFAICDRCGRS